MCICESLPKLRAISGPAAELAEAVTFSVSDFFVAKCSPLEPLKRSGRFSGEASVSLRVSFPLCLGHVVNRTTRWPFCS